MSGFFDKKLPLEKVVQVTQKITDNNVSTSSQEPSNSDIEDEEVKKLLKEKTNSDEFNKYTEDFKRYLSSSKQIVKSPTIKTFTIIINMQDTKNGDKNIPEDQKELMEKGLNKLKQVYNNNIVINYPYKHSIIEPKDNKDDCNDPPSSCIYKSNSTDHLLLLINKIKNQENNVNIIFCGYYGDTFVIYKLLDLIQRLNYLFISPNNDGIKYEYIKKIYFSFAGTIFRKDKLFNTFTPSPCNIRLSINNNEKYLKKDGEKEHQDHASDLNLNIKNHRLWIYEAFEKTRYNKEKIYFGNIKYYNDFVKKNGNDVRMDEFYILDYNGNDLFYTDDKKEKLAEMKIKFYNEIYDIDIDKKVQLKNTINRGSIDNRVQLKETKNKDGILNQLSRLTRKKNPNILDQEANPTIKVKPTGGKNRKTRKVKAKKTRKFRVKKPRKRSL